MRNIIALCLVYAHHAYAQYPPVPQGLELLQSKIISGASISYKEVSSQRNLSNFYHDESRIYAKYLQTHICETTPNVKSFSGYIHLPTLPEAGGIAPHMFFWYFGTCFPSECCTNYGILT
jgi:hypothetical protein